ncbi:hypothetical protein MNV49_004338 [Pseudohyphozyma bogoriensis]|nr:hypothetical protein MNV49_004338 [Pseudohyphozyma bogoriensis]
MRRTNKLHALPGFSPFGSGETNEFATWTQGREKYMSSPKLRESVEDDLRSFAERSDYTEGFMITTPISDAFGGFSSVFLEALRDEFTKSTIFTTATLSDSLSWKRKDNDRSIAQRIVNAALSMQHLEEHSSILLPIQPSKSWEPETPWAAYLRDDLPKPATYSQVLTTHLQSANTELREIDGLSTIPQQLNWRGDNKIAHLVGASPLLPPHLLEGENGPKKLKASLYDFSVLHEDLRQKKPSTSSGAPKEDKPFAQYSIVRGYEDEELQKLGEVLEGATELKEPLARWVAEPAGFPILPSLPPIYRSLIPTGRPLELALPPHPDPLSPAGLFGLPDPLFPANLSRSYYVQPESIPLLTTLETSTSARHLLLHLSTKIKELQRERSSVLWEYEEGEYGIGREGVGEARERLETLADGLAAAGGMGLDDEEDLDEDENFPDNDKDDEDWD